MSDQSSQVKMAARKTLKEGISAFVTRFSFKDDSAPSAENKFDFFATESL